MAEIRVLNKALAELIAAGEVVERPASIAKELIENAVDAGASAVTVEIEGGGVSLLRISDNGCGIPRGEVPTAFLRHATSKISAQSDLDAILTLGFRGEALASVAAMARVELTTKTAGEEEGTSYRIEGGEALGIGPAGCPTGTVITVRDVFYNTPARMKFLKKDVGEGNAVAQTVDKCALSHPEVAFRFLRDGKVRLQTSGSGELLPVIQAVYGKEFAASMRPVEYAMPQEGISVKGYVTSPAGAKPGRTYQNFFLNGRYVRSRTAMAALEEAFRTHIGSGKYPGCVLYIDIAPSLVDVNVHPAKIEVRFVNEKPVFHCVYFAAMSAVSPKAGGEERAPLSDEGKGRLSPERPKPFAPPERMTAAQFKVAYSPEESLFNKPIAFHASSVADIYVGPGEGNPALPDKKTIKPPSYDGIHHKPYSIIVGGNAGNTSKNATYITEIKEYSSGGQTTLQEKERLRVIGELAGVYILLDRGGELVIVDKHAAHERILYERLKKELAYGNRQVLLTPITLTLARESHGALVESLSQVEALGFLAEDFGGSSLLVRETPIELGERDVALLIEDIAEKLLSGKRDLTPDILDRLLFSIACKGAVRARDKNSIPELAAIVDMLDDNPDITHCPHGRPVRVSIGAHEIEKLFGRQG